MISNIYITYVCYIIRMRIPKTITLNIEVVKAFEEVIPVYQRSRVIDALMIKYLVEENQ